MSDTINKLLEELHHKELVLPEFQREFTWSRNDVRKLFESLYRGYPTGSLLVWVTENPPKIKNDAYDLEKVRRVKVLLDGQQRLTSLYLYVYGKVPPYYRSDEISESYFDLYFNAETGEFGYYKKMEMEADPLWIPLQKALSDGVSAFDLVDTSGDEHQGDVEPLLRRVNDNLQKLREILKREYPVQEVPGDADIREAIQVFDLINSQGTPLSKADIALAYMTAEWPDVRRKMKEKIDELSDENFTFDLTFLTRCLAASLDSVGDLARFGNPPEDELRTGWSNVSDALDYLVNFLRTKAFVTGTEDLNTPNVLVPLVFHLARHGRFESDETELFRYWMYAALVQRRYSGSVETNLHQDITSLSEEDDASALIHTLQAEEGDFEVTPAHLDLRGVRNPLYEMMCFVLRSRGAVDWANGLPLVKNTGAKYQIQRHHIFPRSVLEKAGWNTGSSQYDKKRVHEIANRIPLTQQGNLEIFDQEPAEYLPMVEEKYPGALEKSLVPTDPRLWQVEYYEEFLRERRRLISEAINRFMNELAPVREVAA